MQRLGSLQLILSDTLLQTSTCTRTGSAQQQFLLASLGLCGSQDSSLFGVHLGFLPQGASPTRGTIGPPTTESSNRSGSYGWNDGHGQEAGRRLPSSSKSTIEVWRALGVTVCRDIVSLSGAVLATRAAIVVGDGQARRMSLTSLRAHRRF